MRYYYKGVIYKSKIFNGIFDILEEVGKCYEIQVVTDYESVGREFESLQARQ